MGSRSAAVVVALTITLGHPALAAALCGGTQLCAAGPGDCAVVTDCTLTLPPGGLVIDLGARRLVIRKNLKVVGPGGAELLVLAQSVETDGGSVIAAGAEGIGGRIRIQADGDVVVRNGTLFDVRAAKAGGVVDIATLNGNLQFAGRIRANGTTRESDGGEIALFAAGELVATTTAMDASGGDLGWGGYISLESETGRLVVNAPLDVRGGSGGDVSLVAGTTLSLAASGSIDASATGDASPAGAIDIEAEGDVTLDGAITGNGSRADTKMNRGDAGEGADLTIDSLGGAVTIRGTIELLAAPGAIGGNLGLTAMGPVTMAKRVLVSSQGTFGVGGRVSVSTVDGVTILDRIDAGGDTGSGGAIDVDAEGDLAIAGPLTADGAAGAGEILLTGCNVTIAPTGALSSRGPRDEAGSGNQVRAGGTITIRGPLRAAARNRLRYRTVPPAVAPGVVVQPPATLERDSTIPCCVSCPPPTTTTTTTTSTTTTTTTTTSTTTTTTTTTTSSSVSIPTTTSTTSTASSTTSTTAAGEARCGDGIVGGTEECDDGNTSGGDCCSPTCSFEASGSACASDGNPCTVDACNGRGACTHAPGNAGVVCRPAVGVCDLAERCDGVREACPADQTVADGAPCGPGGCGAGGICTGGVCREASGGPCGACEACDPATGRCVPAPRSDCLAPAGRGRSRLVIHKSIRGPQQDRVQWEWQRGPAMTSTDFGDPLARDDMTVCLYERSQTGSRLLFRATVAPGGQCPDRPCWTSLGDRGFEFRNPLGNADGVLRLRLLTSPRGSRIGLLAGGPGLADRPFGAPRPPLALPVIAQLHAAGGRCWQSTFARPGVRRNDELEFRAGRTRSP